MEAKPTEIAARGQTGLCGLKILADEDESGGVRAGFQPAPLRNNDRLVDGRRDDEAPADSLPKYRVCESEHDEKN